MGEEIKLWRIPFSSLNYGQHIALKQHLQGKIQEVHPGTRLQITGKSGDLNGYYIEGTKEAAEFVVLFLEKRAYNFFHRTDIRFSIEEVADQEEAESEILDEGLVREIEEGVKIVYNATIENLSAQVSETSAEVSRLKNALAEKEKPTVRESLDALTESCIKGVSGLPELYDTVMSSINIEDLMFKGRAASDYARERTRLYAEKEKISGWEELLDMELKEFSESDECPFSQSAYEKIKSERDGLLHVITTAPEQVKEIVETALKEELERKQGQVNNYERAEQEYNERLAKARKVQAEYGRAEKEQESRLARVNKVKEDIILLSELKIGFMIKRKPDSVVVNVGVSQDAGSRFNKDIEELIKTAAREYSIEMAHNKDSASYIISEGDPSAIERNLYNRLSTSSNTNFNKLGVKFNVCLTHQEDP
jgi:hypothetical protein